ncbi:MAG TPA: DUF5916 domain-containing protein [Gemmatimonadaceae bacterium]|nr:DUF5916 domain-containing protein [Gemmatimonadaceae bacterium]
MKRPLVSVGLWLLAIPSLLVAQRQEGAAGAVPAAGSSPASSVAIASRAAQPIVIDGREDDAVWKDAMVIDGFRTFTPVQNGDPRMRTVAKIAYDEKNVYVFTRMYDPAPDSIVNLMSRRDARTNSDWIKVMLDPYHDRRSGFEFAVNPGGVKRDYAIIDDGMEDQSWDAIWEVGTRIDSLGWVAEFRIPLNQLRYQNATDHTFGIMIWRDVARHNERYSWPNYDRSTQGLSSKFGQVTGINGVVSPRRMEFAPYTVAQSANVPTASGYANKGNTRFGADLKYGLTSNLTIDATFNPDFGQVEADPSEVNLSGFETFFSERRPFFLEGQGAFSSNINLLYSRRIGRGPQLGGLYYDRGNVNNSTILGAAKLTGRLANGVSIGILNAVTQREVGALSPAGVGQTIEPQTNYFAGRAAKDFRSGASSIGAMLTSVNRRTDEFTETYLRKDALAGALDARHQFLNRNYQVSGYFAASRVSGTAAAITSTQQNLTHNYLRPDDDIVVDPNATHLDGYAARIVFNKRGGGRTIGNFGMDLTSPGFEINDLGFLSRASNKSQFAWLQYQWNKPSKLYRQGNVNFNQWSNWTWDNLQTNLGGNVNSHWELPNSMWLHAGVGVNGLNSYCDDCLRGGPAVRSDPTPNGWWGIDGDPRNVLVPGLFGHWSVGSGGRGRNWGIDPYVSYRVGSALNGSLGYSYYNGRNPRQFAGNFGEIGNDTTHYTVAKLEQTQHSVNVRMAYTMTPTLSLELFASPFSSHGNYSNWLQIADARATDWNNRYTAYNGGDPGAFDFKQYRSNTVLRWEYRPGSTVYVVWAQERTMGLSGAAARSAPKGLGELKKAHPDNVFLIKGSYWFSM